MRKSHNALLQETLRPEFDDFMKRAREVRWSPADVPYAQIDYSKLAVNDLFAVFVTLLIENYSDVYTQGLLHHFADTPLFCDFIRNWEREEENHARVLEKYLTTVGLPLDELRAHYAKVDKADFPFPGDDQTELNAFVFIQELMTREMYTKMLKSCREPVLQGILKKIVRDEERHYRFYKRTLELRIELDPTDSYRKIGKTIRTFTMPQTMFSQRAMTDQLMAYYRYSLSEILAIAKPVVQMLGDHGATPRGLMAFPRLAGLWRLRRAIPPIARSTYVWNHLAATFAVGLKKTATNRKQEREHVQSVLDRLHALLTKKSAEVAVHDGLATLRAGAGDRLVAEKANALGEHVHNRA